MGDLLRCIWYSGIGFDAARDSSANLLSADSYICICPDLSTFA